MIIIQYEEYRKINEAVMPGVNDLETWCKENNREDLLREWDYEKNGETSPLNTTKGSNKKVWWKCKNCENEWEAAICKRTDGRGCPECAKQKRGLAGSSTKTANGNDFETWCKQSGNENLLDEWDYDRNELKPNQFSKGTDKKVWWTCPRGHSYYAAINKRKSGRGCSVCRGFSIVPGVNDLSTTNPEIAEEWDYEKNDTTPENVTRGTHQKVWWLCPNGHSYEQSIDKRTSRGQGCPYCGGVKVLAGYNDLATWCKKNGMEDILDKWDYEKNNISPSDVCKTSDKTIWWKCPFGHSFVTSVHSMTNGTVCPVCSNKKILVGYNDLATTDPDALQWWDYKKNEITPEQVTRGSGTKVWWKCPEGHSFEKTVGDKVSSDKGCPICAGAQVLSGYNDLETWCKQSDNEYLLNEWDYEKNGDLTPQDITRGTAKKVWWVCPEGHSFNQAVLNRTQGETGCPICANKKILVGYNDLETWCKENDMEYLLDEWDYDKNDITPQEVTKASPKQIAWVCPKGHPYKSAVYNRTTGKGCPYCSGRKVLVGYNDLETWCKENDMEYLLDEWDYDKNDITPQEVTKAANQRVMWLCPEGHSYESSINSRTGGRGCAICANKKVLVGYNDLETWCKENDMEYLLDEWDYDKNDITPQQVTRGNDKKVWWICPKGHSYDAAISSRTSGSGCRICSGFETLSGFNDLETWCRNNGRNDILDEWDYDKNDILPNEISRANHKKVWWVCPKGHSYKSSIDNRMILGRGCPTCGALRTASVPEKLAFFYLDLAFKDKYQIIANDREALENGTELDIYIPALKVAVEYDGSYYHKEKTNKEIFKNKQCKRKGIELIRIREPGLSVMDDCYCIMRTSDRSLTDMNECIQDMLDHISTVADVELSYDIWDIGGENDFINCKRDLAEATRLRDEM